MKRRVLYFRKVSEDVIQGVCRAGVQYVAVGHACNTSELHGGGFVSSIEYDDQGGLVEIRKEDGKGKPHRDFGEVNVGGINGSRKLRLIADGVLVPAIRLFSIVFSDEPEGDDIDKPARPVQQQGQQRGK